MRGKTGRPILLPLRGSFRTGCLPDLCLPWPDPVCRAPGMSQNDHSTSPHCPRAKTAPGRRPRHRPRCRLRCQEPAGGVEYFLIVPVIFHLEIQRKHPIQALRGRTVVQFIDDRMRSIRHADFHVLSLLQFFAKGLKGHDLTGLFEIKCPAFLFATVPINKHAVGSRKADIEHTGQLRKWKSERASSSSTTM